MFEAELRRAGFVDVAIRPVIKEWTVASAEALSANFLSMSPPTAALFETLSEDDLVAFGKAFIAELKSTFADGPVRFEAEALVGLATKPE